MRKVLSFFILNHFEAVPVSLVKSGGPSENSAFTGKGFEQKGLTNTRVYM